jgi:putative endonuclease
MREKHQIWQVYIIKTGNGKLYTGITTDIKRRFKEHQNRKGAKYFRLETPENIVFLEAHENRSKATKREIEIKKLNRKEKLKLIKAISLT